MSSALNFPTIDGLLNASRAMLGSALGSTGLTIGSKIKPDVLHADYETARKIVAFVSKAAIHLMAGVNLFAATNCILPLIGSALTFALSNFNFLSKGLDDKLTTLAWTINTYANGVLLYTLPSWYHLACLIGNASFLFA